MVLLLGQFPRSMRWTRQTIPSSQPSLCIPSHSQRLNTRSKSQLKMPSLLNYLTHKEKGYQDERAADMRKYRLNLTVFRNLIFWRKWRGKDSKIMKKGGKEKLKPRKQRPGAGSSRTNRYLLTTASYGWYQKHLSIHTANSLHFQQRAALPYQIFLKFLALARKKSVVQKHGLWTKSLTRKNMV